MVSEESDTGQAFVGCLCTQAVAPAQWSPQSRSMHDAGKGCSPARRPLPAQQVRAQGWGGATLGAAVGWTWTQGPGRRGGQGLREVQGPGRSAAPKTKECSPLRHCLTVPPGCQCTPLGPPSPKAGWAGPPLTQGHIAPWDALESSWGDAELRAS